MASDDLEHEGSLCPVNAQQHGWFTGVVTYYRRRKAARKQAVNGIAGRTPQPDGRRQPPEWPNHRNKPGGQGWQASACGWAFPWMVGWRTSTSDHLLDHPAI
jgi:hypothetical protein